MIRNGYFDVIIVQNIKPPMEAADSKMPDYYFEVDWNHYFHLEPNWVRTVEESDENGSRIYTSDGQQICKI